MWGTGRLDMFLGFAIALISLFNIRRLSISDLVAISLFSFYTIYAAATKYNIFGIIPKLVIIPFLMLNKNVALIYFNWFKNFFVLSLLLSLIVYFLIVIFSIPIGYNLISPLNEGKLINYIQYPFLVSERLLGFQYFNIRFCGMFDEPGVVGAFSLILLFADRFNFRSKQNIILLIAGIVSFSFYFYVISIIYFIIFSRNKIRFQIISIILGFYLLTSINPVVDDIIWSRFEIQGATISGDNRSSDALNSTYNQFVKSSDFLWGRGINYAFDYAEGSASFKLVLIAYGLIFLVNVFLAFSYYAYINVKKPKYLLAFLFLFIGMFYNRYGFIFDPARFFIFIACIYAINYWNEGKFSSPNSIDNRKNPRILYSE